MVPDDEYQKTLFQLDAARSYIAQLEKTIMDLKMKVSGPDKCTVCKRVAAVLYDRRCGYCAASGSLYGHLPRCQRCGAYEGGEHVFRMHDPRDPADPFYVAVYSVPAKP